MPVTKRGQAKDGLVVTLALVVLGGALLIVGSFDDATAATIPNDPDYNLQWSLPKTQAPDGWDITTGSPSAVIAVIGTGVEFTHEDLAANIWSNPGETPGNGLDDDNNGYVDDVRGWDFTTQTSCQGNLFCNGGAPNDIDGHETQVAGVAAAVGNNGLGIAGVCWSCKIMPLKVGVSAPSGFPSDLVASAINYAVNNGAKIIVMSFSSSEPLTYGPDTVVKATVDNAAAHGVLMVAAAGDDAHTSGYSGIPSYPAAFSNVIGVAATDQNDQRWTLSNWGSWVKVAAPGVTMVTTDTGGNNQYTTPATISGTSLSTGFVAGIAGLLFSKYPSLSVSDATNAILTGVDAITPDHPIGSGRVNVLKALQAAAPTPTPTPIPTPTPSPTPSPTPTLTPTPTPCPDTDGDGWTDCAEAIIGTDPNRACGTDAWPADLNNDTFSDITDISALAGSFGKAVPPAAVRYDIAPDPPDGFVDITDIARIAAFFGKSCTTPTPTP